MRSWTALTAALLVGAITPLGFAQDVNTNASVLPTSGGHSDGRTLGPPPAPENPAGQAPTPGPPPAGPGGPEELTKTLEKLGQGVEALSKRLTVLTVTDQVKLIWGGQIVADFLFNESRPVAAGTPFFVSPPSPFGFSQQTFDAHARQTSLFALVQGPKLCCGALDFETGGLILVNLYNDAILPDRYGFLPLQAWGHVKNDEWRLAAGLQFDIFNPLNPTILPFSYLMGSGNVGIFRGQARVEHYCYLDGMTQVTLTAGISEPIATALNTDFKTLTEDNGWPNLEGRAAISFGRREGEGMLAKRPIEFGVSGVVGQMRTTEFALVGNRVVADVWGLGADIRVAFTPRCGVQGEVYCGQGLGTYGGAILQNLSTATFEPIASKGGWAEFYFYWIPDCVHSHVGYGFDDPDRADLALGQLDYNETVFANLLWDVTKFLRLGLELTLRKTEYVPRAKNDDVGVHWQAMWKF